MTLSSGKRVRLIRWLEGNRELMLRVARPYASGVITAEDIVQMAAMRALERVESLRDGASPGPWVLRITTRTGLDVAEKRQHRMHLRDEHLDPRPDLDGLFAFSRGLKDDPRRDQVLSAMASLSSAQREVVHCQLEGMSYEETAAQLDKSVGAVRVLRHRAVRKLKKVLSAPPSAEETRKH